MRKGMILFSILIAAVAIATGFLSSGIAEAEDFTYVGLKKCSMCHKSEKSGQQFQLWEKNAHSKAFATLASSKALEIAKTKGIEDPQKADECLKCHATAAAVPADQRAKGVVLEDGVTCESCHGPGSAYKKKSVMEALYTGAEKGEKYGLTTITEKTCTACHNEESPTYKPFDYKARVEQIAHPVPTS